MDGGQRISIAGVEAQVEVGEEGAFDELAVGRGRRLWIGLRLTVSGGGLELYMLAGALGVVEGGVAAAGGEPAVVVDGGYVETLAVASAAAGDHGQGDRAAERRGCSSWT